jgi:hypothetical protein
MEKLPFVDRESIRCAIVEIEEVRCDMNADFTERLADSERFEEGRFWKQRREFEKRWRDPDDVYIDVQRREEERKKQGLRRGSAFSHIPLWPKRSKSGRSNRNARKSPP